MKGSNDLFQLIKSLSKTERRYFKLYTAKYKSKRKNNYLKLFEAISKQDEYDEEEIKKVFNKTTIVKNLSMEKNYLYGILLDSLTSFHSYASIDSTIKNLLSQVEILHKKILYNQCEKLLLRAKRLAFTYEKYPQLLEILEWEIKMGEADVLKLRPALQKNREEKRSIIKQYANLSEYQYIHYNIFALAKEHDVVRDIKSGNELNKLFDNPLLSNANNALSHEAKLLFHNIHNSYFYAKIDSLNAYKHAKEIVRIIESRPEIIERNPLQYLKTLNNFIIDCINLGKHSDAFSSIKKIRTIKQKSIDIEVRIFVMSYNYELSIYILSGEFEKSIRLINTIEQGLKKYKGKIPSSKELSFFHAICYNYFGIGEYKKALAWSNKILDHEDASSREDIYSFQKIFNLIIHFELGNLDLLEYNGVSAYRYLNKKERLHKFESVVLNSIKKMSKAITSPNNLTTAFKELKELLIPLSKDPLEKNSFDYFDFISWLESKITKRPFADIVKGKVGQAKVTD